MKKVLLDQVVDTDYGQFDLFWILNGGFDGNFDRFFAGQVNGVVGASSPDGVYLNFARRSGGSGVRIVLTDAPPVANHEWEDVVEVSFDFPQGDELRWSGWAGMSGGTLGGIAGGCYRMRVSASGRDEGRDGEFSDDVLDFYQLELWPAPWKPDAIVRVGSDDARYWHREVGSRR